ncbi:CHAT domain-containing protein [Microseira wollei]|uniref:CHAT domain-containing protein n=1 Tax=Microseira wollei NIES-4236 TaxID=2530354 RepID=A0AAV3WEB1_9CYAN|nr:CHAT domain-containing protein [Microseira wollei]GET35424.1 hypothetical protein MiSe_01660 [Microseira wollei NIES-4236]
MITKIFSPLKSLHSSVWLALLTLFFVITVFPAASFDFKLGHSQKYNQSLTTHSFNPKYAFPGSNLGTSKIQNHTLTVLEQGRTLYEAGRFSDAAAVWQQAVKELAAQGDRFHLAVTLTYLSNVYQELGQWEQASETIAKSLNLIQSGDRTGIPTLILAQALNTQASLQLALGQTEAALNTWQLAEKAYTQAKDETGILGSQINQAQALQILGLYRRAQAILEQVNQKLLASPDSLLKATGLRSLGIALQVTGDLERSQAVLQQSLAIASKLNSAADISAAYFALGNTARISPDPKLALELYQKAAENAKNAIAKLEALLNQLSLLVQTKQQATARASLPNIQAELAKLSPSRDAVYAQVNYAQSLIELEKDNQLPTPNSQEIAKILAVAVQQAISLNDPKAESYALIELGKLYELSQQWVEAENLTQQALLIAQKIRADDIVGRTQAQLGQIFKQRGDWERAIASYTEAVKTFQSLRSDLVAVNSDVQFSFRDSVEPVYRELVGLLLQFNPSQENIQQARQLLEALQLAELENFFREACLRAKPQQIEQIDPTAAVFYPIILKDRLEVIVSLPGESLRRYTSELPQSEVEKAIDELLESLNPFFSSRDRLRVSQKIYDWLIRPIEAELAGSLVKTLVFILDGSLRNLPMAALHNGQYYLVEKYNIAVTPGLQLLEARALAQAQLKVLTAGLTEARQGFAALPGVKLEVEQIAAELPARTFLDREFTEKNLQKQIQATSFPIIHLATHGQFSSNPEQTFILTWDEKIKVKEFEDLLRFREQGNANPIELLVLSACQTAAGDKRAALGLAGVAVRSGARSTLATLWSVKDQSTAQLMSEFYQELSKGVRKAEALRTAQLNLLKQTKYQHPFYWAPFVLVGNWL